MTRGDNCDVRIRRATLGDLAAITALCSAHATYERAAFDTTGHAENMAVAISGVAPRAILLLAEIDAHVVGYTSIAREFSTWTAREYLHMDCLFVTECRRGQGIGRKLLNAVINEANSSAIAEVQWQTPDWNADAIQLYRAMGAVDRAKARFVLKLP